MIGFIGNFFWQVQASQPYTDGEELGLSIMGSITNDDPYKNVSLIKETKSGKVTAVKIGYKILEGYVVEEITYRYVTLSQNQKKIIVYLEKFASQFTKALLPSSQREKSPMSVATQNYQEPGFERIGNGIKVNQSYMNHQLQSNLGVILNQATAIPAMEDGRIIGFTLYQIDSDSIFAKSGLQDYDIVTAINGQALDSAAGAVRFLQKIRGEKQFKIALKRQGKEELIEIKVQE